MDEGILVKRNHLLFLQGADYGSCHIQFLCQKLIILLRLFKKRGQKPCPCLLVLVKKMEMIAEVLEAGSQAIVLIPEIALTYQTVMRFYGRFGDRVSILNSRMSAGERSM